MYTNHIFGNVNEALPALMTHLLAADEVGSRLGERTLEMTAVGITLTQPWQREIVLPERKASIGAQIAETMWVLAGRTDIGWLSHYLPRAVDFSDDGTTWRAGYGQRLRNYHGKDQIAYVVDLLQRSPGSRQAVATIWDPTVDTEPGKDIACNNWLDFLARKGKLDLTVGIRSNDSVWGWSGINAFEWSALLEIVAGMIGHEVGSLHFAVGSFHLYDRHWAKARLLSEQGGNFRYSDSPRFDATGMDDMSSFDYCAEQWFEAEEQIRTGQAFDYDVDNFPEPMLRSWLLVLQWYWSGDVSFLQPLRHTRLYEACRVSVTPPGEPQAAAVPHFTMHEDGTVLQNVTLPGGFNESWGLGVPGFLEHVNALHAEKHAAYGDSWKRRGEYMIMANIARKVDRLDSGMDTSDETQTDTAIDLMVYLAKYRCWINGGTGDPDEVEEVLVGLVRSQDRVQPLDLVEDFADLERAEPGCKLGILNPMLEKAFTLAWERWSR